MLESGEPLAFWFSTPNRVRLSVDSSGSTATAMGKLILGVARTVSATWKNDIYKYIYKNTKLLLVFKQKMVNKWGRMEERSGAER